LARPLICLCLTGKTLAEDAAIAERYKSYVDLVELRVDFLEENERLKARVFPSMVPMPCILTIRRVSDGGQYDEGEGSRTILFAMAMSFSAKQEKVFDYVDFEEDFNVPSLNDAALAFGIKIIRSFHDMHNPVKNIAERIEKMRKTGFEIPKIAFMPHDLSDIADLAKEVADLKDSEQIICAMGSFGLPTRILSERFNSYLTYTSPAELLSNLSDIGHLDPKTLCELYRFKDMNKDTMLFGITGFPLKVTSSPLIHNTRFKTNNMNAVYIPFKADTAKSAFDFVQTMGIKGFSVTVPHKEEIIKFLDKVDHKVEDIGACNTVVYENDAWVGYNTDCTGFARSLLSFTGLETLRGKRVAIIGAGGAAKAICYVVKELGAKACIFNRTLVKARLLAEKYGFESESLDAGTAFVKLKKYSDIIIQTTSKGMGNTDEPNEVNDPLWFYDFAGTEIVYDIIYEPESTAMLTRARRAGCRVCNGYSMLEFQGEEQAKLFQKIYGENS